MSINVALHHATRYRYDRQVQLYPQTIRLRPAPHARTRILSYSIKVEPEPHFLNWVQDPQSNWLARVVFPELVEEFTVDVDLVAEMAVIDPFDFFLEDAAEQAPFRYSEAEAKDLRPYLETEPAGPRLQALLASIDRTPRRTIDFLVDLNQRLQREIGYVIRMEPGVQSTEETLGLARGSCRDSGWLLVQVLRHLGLAARFASGYLIQLKADEKALDGPSGTDHDFTDLHAWAEVYLPGAGWVGLDPTSGLFAGEGHIPLACTPDPSSAAPISGIVGGDFECDFGFEMKVERIHEDPRVTLPYSEAQWAAISAAGHAVDARLAAGDVRLTMGGEPTFVSIDDPDGDEWNVTALGPDKRLLAGDLVRRLRDRFADGALLHFGQGKWYPGEPLPRWALGCYWRRDGEPIWTDKSLVADDRVSDGMTAAHAEQFITALAVRLGIEPERSIPAWEDIWYYMARERRLPVNIDPLDHKLDDKLERDRLARVFEQGLGSIVGYALPLAPTGWTSHVGWQTGRWFLRTERMYLLPGDSPMGLRLPLDSLPWLPEGERAFAWETDPMAPRRTLPPRLQLSRKPGEKKDAPAMEPLPPGFLRTALCVEPRDGRLHVFMPPAPWAEAYLDLVAAVEDTARTLGMRVLIEGYQPPHDFRIRKLEVTPDPGVLEVNIHPADHWGELEEHVVGLYEEARLTRLGTEKFMVDGRHSGTGGGNHVTIGSAYPWDSPLLRRPDLLASLLVYWQHHPALSYVFSGLFIGPTCQAPRIDEARHDQLHELEIAIAELPREGTPPPWLVDRIFRHLLVDVSGNTHRAEFCIDKLYDPESARGRLGLLELRAFEMPPHARMSLVQQLLLRALIARFWETPYRRPFVRWGTILHDRFLLPHFLAQDLRDVLAECRDAGFDLDPEWFRPHLEFRFPHVGSVAYAGLELDLRTALEPWHVLGEEGGTVRYVDSSVERLQVLVRAMTDTRHVVTCNGRPLPLHPTGTAGEFVAGVRYRAWQPPSCLHPTIGVHSPLVFDVVDIWAGRSIGGCVYHVAHPGGRAHETRPVNAYEAESRRIARFFRFGHTPGTMVVTPERPHPDFPLTLDLRR
ncbi:MAG: transglutaminase family protein [bacterium]|nr:transglutaminase family protein [bacterium]